MKIELGLYFRNEKNIRYNLKIVNTIYFKTNFIIKVFFFLKSNNLIKIQS